MSHLPRVRSIEGGVEEKKDDDPVVLSPAHSNKQSSSDDAAAIGENGLSASNEESENCFQAQVQNFAKTVLGSCGNALSFMGWPGTAGGGTSPHRGVAARPPLSITDELRKLAAKEGRLFGGGMRRADIPRFLGEEGVYSFEDDNISAISQNTIEEMTKHGIKYPVRRKASSESSQNTPPSPLGGGATQRKRRAHTNTDLIAGD